VTCNSLFIYLVSLSVCLSISQSVSQSVNQSISQSVSRASNSYIMRKNLLVQAVESSGKLERYVVARQRHNKRDSYVLSNDAVYL